MLYNCVLAESNEKKHAAWDIKCPVYIKAVDKIRTDLLK